jgi:TRAP-type C4-dicarboxylate transport system permease small subunit
MSRLTRISEALGLALALCASVGVILMMLHVCLDVALRAAFAAPIPATVEIVSRYDMVLIAFLPLAWVEWKRGMISVELFTAFLTPRLQRVSDAAVALVATLVYGVMTYTTWLVALDNYATGTFVLALSTKVPVWPSYLLPPLGFGLASLATLLRLAMLAAGRTETAADGQGAP